MPLYVTISEGPRADLARPLLAVSDQSLIAELLRAIGRKGAYVAEDNQSPEPPTLRMVGAGKATREGVTAHGR